jgi:hypothetical protein
MAGDNKEPISVKRQSGLTDDSIAMFSDGLKAVSEKSLEFSERLAVHPAQHLHVFRW